MQRYAIVLLAAAASFAPGLAAAQDIVLSPANVTKLAGRWAVMTDSSAAGGKVVRHPDAGAAKRKTASAAPTDFFEMQFQAEAGKSYRLWLHGKADRDYWGNDSVFVQFTNSLNASGSAAYRIGTTSAAEVNLEECSGCGVRGWKWQDNGYGSGILGPVVRFATTGTQTIRVQTREDGMGIDEITLSPLTYLKTPPAGHLVAGSTTATEVVLSTSNISKLSGKWVLTSDSSAVGGKSVRHPDGGAGKVTTAIASPTNYFEIPFYAVKGVGYRLWVHGRADSNFYGNDSVFVQFSSSVTSSGSSVYRIGTTSATEMNLEDCNGCGLNGWKWQDNGWGKGVLGSVIYFASTGTHTLRVQTREDGLAIDQIILSPSKYLAATPPQTSTATNTTTAPAPAPAPAPDAGDTTTTTTTTGNILKVLDWNIHHGTDQNGVCALSRQADWIVKTGANVVSLNEVEKMRGWCNNEDQVAKMVSLLKTKTGKTWYYNFASLTGTTNGQGNLILTTFPIESSGDYLLSYSMSVARVAIIVNGIRVNIYSTHLDASSSSRRTVQIRELTSWADNYPEQRILAGDFNAWPGTGEITNMTSGHYDSWAEAVKDGTAVTFSGNDGDTRNSRIDYVWFSKGASRLVLRRSQVFDTRNSSGVMASDHRPLLTTFEVR